jgi:hypothetical protein
LRPGDALPLPRKVTNCLLVAAEGRPLIEAGVELASEFAQSPTLLGSLNFIEFAFLLFEADQEYIVRPAQEKRRVQRISRRVQLAR